MICASCSNLTIDRLYTRACEYVPTKSGWNQTSYLILHPTYECLEAAASEGCENCQTFHVRFVAACGDVQAFREKLALLAKSQDASLPIIAFLHMESGGGKRTVQKLNLQVGAEPWKPGVDHLNIAFRICVSREYSEEKEPHGYLFRFVHIDKDLGSDENFRLARNWIQDCCGNHDDTICPPIADNVLPTRLIDIGPPDGSMGPRLVQPPKSEKGRYLALSHCWGVSTIKERLTTTLATLDQRLESIPMSLMPANFYDATIITRRLGYRYLWIDSLCIVQDSAEDWEAESQNMGNIYMNASLTIAAGAAKDSDGGMLRKDYKAEDLEARFEPSRWFLQDRQDMGFYALQNVKPEDKVDGAFGEGPNDNKPKSCHLKIYGNEESPTVTLEPWLSFSDKEENWYRCTVVGPLAARGWCLQERLLSHRILYYGVRQIYWQCASSRKAADGETVPMAARTSFRSAGSEATESPDLLSLKRLHSSINAEDVQMSPEEKRKIETKIFKTWHSILFAYVNRRLTKQTDKLPALTGMARLIHHLTGDTYVAGFWRKYLMVSLIWTHTASSIREYDLRSIYEQYQMDKPQWEHEKPWLEGPSWSWASAHFYDRLDFWADRDEKSSSRVWSEQDANILEVEMDRVGQSDFGRVKSGRLTLRGFTYPRWDVRTSGWDPMDSMSSMILGFCPHSPWNRGNDEFSRADLVLWDYYPRQRLSSVTRLLLHIGLYLLRLFTPLFWQGLYYSGSGPKPAKPKCPACMEYLCMHILSIVDRLPSEAVRIKSGKKMYEVTLWSLILEPVAGNNETYRRIGIVGKVIYVSEEEFERMTDSGSTEKELPEIFASWKLKTLTII